MDIESLYRLFLTHPVICTDSRQVTPGSLFFALRGEQFDGNRFAPAALQKGAAAAIVDDPAMEGLANVIVTGNVLLTLQRLAHLHRERSRVKVLALTGTNGKTTTKELIAAVLSTRFRTLATRGNLNNHIGVPLTLLSLRDESVAVVEMGANHPGEIALLSDIADPDVGLITNVGKAHLEGFGSFEGVMKAKGELYEFLADKEVPALLNTSNHWLVKMAEAHKVDTIPYSLGSGGEGITGEMLSADPYLICRVNTGDEVLDIPTKLVGSYNLENVLAAVTAGKYFRVPGDQIVSGISSYQPENKRSQLISGKSNTIILDAYNANPTSMMNALEDFFGRKKQALMVVLGDMLELGESGPEEHGKIVDWLKDKDCRVCLVGPLFNEAARNVSGWQLFGDTAACIAYLEKEKPSGYAVLVKGSRKMSLEDTTKVLVNC